MITNKAKEEACIKYKNYLDVIDKLGNKIMLEKQLISLCVKLNIARDRFIVLKAIQDLEKAEVIKKINFGGSNNKIIIFKKFAIRFLGGFNSSQHVAAVPKVNSNNRYYLSYFKVQFIIEMIIPSLSRLEEELTLDSLISYIERLNSNILYNKNCCFEYYDNLKNNFKDNIHKNELNRALDILKKEHDTLIKNLGKKTNETKDKSIKKVRKTKWDYLAESNIGTLIRKNIYIGQIKRTDNNIKIFVYNFDVLNSQNVDNIVLNYCICYTLFKRLFNCNIELFFRVIAINKIAEENLKLKLGNGKFKRILRANHTDELDWECMHFKITCFSNS